LLSFSLTELLRAPRSAGDSARSARERLATCSIAFASGSVNWPSAMPALNKTPRKASGIVQPVSRYLNFSASLLTSKADFSATANWLKTLTLPRSPGVGVGVGPKAMGVSPTFHQVGYLQERRISTGTRPVVTGTRVRHTERGRTRGGLVPSH